MNIPWQVAAFVSGVLSLPQRRKVRARREGIRRCDGERPVIGFGDVLTSGGLIHGGAVKLLSLQKAFPSCEQNFNILYLVSSSQPPFAADLVDLCKRRGIRFVWNQNGVGYRAWAGAEAGRHNAVMRQLRDRADFVIYQSDFCFRSASRYLGPSSLQSRILLNPVDTTTFSPRTEPLPRIPLRLLAMGTQNYPDRVFSVLEALARLRDGGVNANLTIAGNLLWNDAEAASLRLAEKLNIEEFVTFRPAFGRREAVDLCRSHHLLIHPKYMDPCPTVVAEALSCGLPVVGTASGGLPEMVPAACGFLVPVAEDWDTMHTPTGQELADAVHQCLPDLDKMSLAARAHALACFDERAWVGAHSGIFLTL